MAEVKYLDFDVSFIKSKLEAQHETGERAISNVSRLIRHCQREYDKLLDRVYKCNVVMGVSATTGFLSAVALLPSEYQDVTEQVPELISTPAGKVVLAGSIGCFAVAGLSKLIKERTYTRLTDNEETQDELYDELAFHQSLLDANENTQAINEIKTAIYGDEVVIPSNFSYEINDVPSTNGGITTELPKIQVIDLQKDFPDLPLSQGFDDPEQ